MSLFISSLHWRVSPQSRPTHLDLNCRNWPKNSRICHLHFLYIFHPHQLAIFSQNSRSAVGLQLSASSTSCNSHSFPQFFLTLFPYYCPHFPSFILIHFLPPCWCTPIYHTVLRQLTNSKALTVRPTKLIIPLIPLHQVTNLNPFHSFTPPISF